VLSGSGYVGGRSASDKAAWIRNVLAHLELGLQQTMGVTATAEYRLLSEAVDTDDDGVVEAGELARAFVAMDVADSTGDGRDQKVDQEALARLLAQAEARWWHALVPSFVRAAPLCSAVLAAVVAAGAYQAAFGGGSEDGGTEELHSQEPIPYWGRLKQAGTETLLGQAYRRRSSPKQKDKVPRSAGGVRRTNVVERPRPRAGAKAWLKPYYAGPAPASYSPARPAPTTGHAPMDVVAEDEPADETAQVLRKLAPGQFVAERNEWSGPLPHRVYRVEDDLRYRIVATNEPGRGWVAVRGFASLGEPMDASDLVNLRTQAGELATGGLELAQDNPGLFATCTLG
jgi:hypothetical protein